MMRLRRINFASRRSGFVIVVILVCVVLMTLLFGSLLKASLSWRRQMRTEEKRVQVEWLADSGLARAVAKMDSDPAYDGEEWKPDAFESSNTVATVTIAVAKTQPVRITVVARADGLRPVTVERSLTISDKKDDNDE